MVPQVTNSSKTLASHRSFSLPLYLFIVLLSLSETHWANVRSRQDTSSSRVAWSSDREGRRVVSTAFFTDLD